MIASSSLDQKVNGIKKVQLFCNKLQTDRHRFAEQALMAPVCRVLGATVQIVLISRLPLNELIWLVNNELHHFVFRQVEVWPHMKL